MRAAQRRVFGLSLHGVSSHVWWLPGLRHPSPAGSHHRRMPRPGHQRGLEAVTAGCVVTGAGPRPSTLERRTMSSWTRRDLRRVQGKAPHVLSRRLMVPMPTQGDRHGWATPDTRRTGTPGQGEPDPVWRSPTRMTGRYADLVREWMCDRALLGEGHNAGPCVDGCRLGDDPDDRCWCPCHLAFNGAASLRKIETVCVGMGCDRWMLDRCVRCHGGW
jgi:hypothetical protein